jgi:hypothetical protein
MGAIAMADTVIALGRVFTMNVLKGSKNNHPATSPMRKLTAAAIRKMAVIFRA